MAEEEIDFFHDTVLKGLIDHSPYYEEMIQLVNIYLDAVANKHIHDINLCIKEFNSFIKRIEDILHHKKKIQFTDVQSKQQLINKWKDDEKHLIYISNDIDGLQREEIKNFHNEIFHTFAGDITSFFEMKKQLSSYTAALNKGEFNEIKKSMTNFHTFMKKENAPEDKKQAIAEINKEVPNFKNFKEKKKFLDSWIIFINLNRNSKIVSDENCPLNHFKIEFLNDTIKKTLNNKDADFEWFKNLVQNLAMNFFNKDYKTMFDHYNAVNRYKPKKKEE